MSLARRHLLAGAAATATASALGIGSQLALIGSAEASVFGETVPFSRARLAAAARALSEQPFQDRRGEVSDELTAMGYDAYRAMQPGPDWPMPLSPANRFYFDPLLAGFVYNQPVDLWYVNGDQAQRIIFDREMFVFRPPAATVVPEGNIPFSGFRLRSELNQPGVLDEFAVFQGASYFRAVGAGENYGLSARGLAINTGRPTGEEFPVFRSFWIERPPEGAKAVVVHALLDSPSTTGAYRITIRPGDATVTDVELTLFPRTDIKTVGFAPFSSMFLFDAINRHAFDDYRDAVHDSGGLSIFTGAGEWLWRPIMNPQRLQVSAFVDSTPRGFGLVQRKRHYSDYQDAEARYETRPTAWVEPIGDWGGGAVVLFEIPTENETNDNIVTYWQPNQPIIAGEPFSLTYRIHWDSAAAAVTQGPRVIATRQGQNFHGTRRLFVIDFAMNGQPIDGISVDVECSAGKAVNITFYPTPEPDVLRTSFELDTDGAESSELRLTLNTPQGPAGERWVFRWTS